MNTGTSPRSMSYNEPSARNERSMNSNGHLMGSNNSNNNNLHMSYHVQMPVYSPEEVIHMIETVSADPKVKDELTAIIRRSAKLSEQRAALSLSITNICGYSTDTSIAGIGDDSGYVVPEGISYDKSQNRYRTSYKDGKRLVQKVFSIRAHGEKKALGMAVEQRKQWIREGKVPIKGMRKESMKTDYHRTSPLTTESLQTNQNDDMNMPNPNQSNLPASYHKFSNMTSSLLQSNTDHMGMPSSASNNYNLGGTSSYDHNPIDSGANDNSNSADMAFILNTFGADPGVTHHQNQNQTNQANDVNSIQYLSNMNMSVATGNFSPY